MPITNAGIMDDFTNNSVSFKNKQKTMGETEADSTKNVEIMVPLKCLNNFWPLINCEINLILTCFANCVISDAINLTGY